MINSLRKLIKYENNLKFFNIIEKKLIKFIDNFNYGFIQEKSLYFKQQESILN